MYTKAKYNDLFDIGILSIHSGISEDMNVLFKKKAKIHVETVDNLCSINKETRTKYREEVTAKCQKADWFELKNPPFSHHMFFQVEKEETEMTKSTAPTNNNDFDSDLDLD